MAASTTEPSLTTEPPLPPTEENPTESTSPSTTEPTTPSTAEPDLAEATIFCPEIPRSALVYPADYDRFDRLLVTALANQNICEIILDPAPTDNYIVIAAEHLYYPIINETEQSVTIWQRSPDGNQQPLEFTTTQTTVQFRASADGRKIGWSPRMAPQPTLQIANIDGTELVTVVDEVSETERRYPLPIRFSSDNQTLYYSLRLDGLGGVLFTSSGRADTLYRVPVTGGQSELIYTCETKERPNLCIGDVSPDGTVFAYTENGAARPPEDTSEPRIHLLRTDDASVIATLTPPALDFAGLPIFFPNGDLIFSSATLESTGGFMSLPTPGYLSRVQPPYTNPPETLLVGDGVYRVITWLDDNHILYDTADGGGSAEIGVLTSDGQSQILPIYYIVGTLL